jgi:proteasome lid subunit RPN8/RPN11
MRIETAGHHIIRSADTRLVAIESFVDDDGHEIQAGVTHCHPEADVVRSRPDAFIEWDGNLATLTRIQDGQLPIQRSRHVEAPRRRTRTPMPLPKLYEELLHPHGIGLGYRVEKEIRRDIAETQEQFGNVESGGWLYASRTNPNYIVKASFPDAVVSASSIELDFDQVERVLRYSPHLQLVGDVHHHPAGDERPSDQDLRGWSTGAQHFGGRWISLITVPSQTWRDEPELHGWITVGTRPDLMFTERIAVA